MKPNTAKPASSISSVRTPPSIASRRISLVAEVEGPPQRTRTPQPIWKPATRATSAPPTTSEVIAATRPPEQLPADLEASILATLTRPLRPDEGYQDGNDNRERELRTAFAMLTPIQAHHLGRRLELDRDGDKLVVAFRRLVVDRRQRLQAFLATSRRLKSLGR